jgi:CubicO group peptidase (beta-lactamase class C family)
MSLTADDIPTSTVSEGPQELGDGWSVSPPAATQFDLEAMEDLTMTIKAGEYKNIHAVLVEQDGKLVYEQYFSGQDENWGSRLGTIDFGPETLHDLRSVTKSVTSLLLGIALGADFETQLQKPVIDFFPHISGEDNPGIKKVTLHHVLTMTAGIEWNEMEVSYRSSRNDENRMSRANDPIAMVLARPIRREAGAKWYYNGGMTQLVAGVIKEITGLPVQHFAEEALFKPLGIFDYYWHRVKAWKSGNAQAASGLRLRPRDLAKIGSLVLSKGNWKGRQVVSSDWIAQSSKRHVTKIPWSPNGTYGYGYMWYPGKHLGPGFVRAVGNGQQRIYVVPERGLAVTIFAGMYNNHYPDRSEAVFRRILRAQETN